MLTVSRSTYSRGIIFLIDKNAPPKANAGGDQVLTAPISVLIINGSQSSDDLRIGQWLWTRDQSSLAIGTIVQDTDKSPVLMVKLKRRFNSHVLCYVTQRTMRAFASLSLIEHLSLLFHLIVNGCSRWSLRLPIESDRRARPEQRRYRLGNRETRLVPIRNSASSFRNIVILSGTKSFFPFADPQLLHLVELTLNIGASMLTVSQKNSLVVKLQMLLRDEASIVVRNLRTEPHTGKAVLVFYVEKKGGKTALPGPEVVKRLKEKLLQDSGLLQLSVANIDTAVCQNNCSGI